MPVIQTPNSTLEINQIEQALQMPYATLALERILGESDVASGLPGKFLELDRIIPSVSTYPSMVNLASDLHID